jgi:MoaA/NifB/PqqE/SkfB family radical SAM enzyme
MSDEIDAAILKKYTLSEGPRTINLETTLRCNLKCKICGHSNPDFTLPPQPDLPMQAIDNLLPVIATAKEIWLSGYGEPLLDPNIFKIIKKIKNTNPTIHTGFTSNAILLGREGVIDQLIESHLDLIQVSFDGYNCQYGHQGAESVMQNLRKLSDRKITLGLDYPKIQVATVLMKSNIQQLKLIIDDSLNAGAYSLVIQPLRVDPVNKDPGLYAEQDIYTNKKILLPIIQEAVDYGRKKGMEIIHQFMDESMTAKRRKCNFPFWFFHVSYDGSVYMCCNGQSSGENLEKKSAMDIWNGESYKRLRYIVDTENYDRRCWECPIVQAPIDDEELLKRELALLSLHDLVDYIILQKRYIREAHHQYDLKNEVALASEIRVSDILANREKKIVKLREKPARLGTRMLQSIKRLGRSILQKS